MGTFCPEHIISNGNTLSFENEDLSLKGIR